MKFRFLLVAFGTFVGSEGIQAQEPQFASLFPNGGQQGVSLEVAVEGKNLKDVHSLFFSQPGISARKVEGSRFMVSIAATVPPGDCDVWVVTAQGLSNPRRFAIGSLPEANEKEKNDDLKSGQEVQLPVVINGNLNMAMDRDYYRFNITMSQRITFHFRSETLDGTARPALTLFGPGDRELMHDDGRDAEPIIDYDAQPGSYLLKVEERAYQKGDSNFYRLAIFSGPRLVGAFPQVMDKGKGQPVTLYGYGLPGGRPVEGLGSLQQIRADIQAPQVGADDGGGYSPASATMLEGFRYQEPKIQGVLRFGLADGPVALEKDELHDSPKQGQPIPFPCVIAGRFLRPREVDWYRFPAKKGQMMWIEAVGEREGRAMDLEVTVHDSQGKPLLTLGPVVVPKGQPEPVSLKSLDPMGVWKATEDDDHFVVVRDFYGTTRWGVDRTYQLRVGQRQEALSVVAIPANGFSVPAGGSANLPLVALRRNGHEGPIRIRAEGLPAGCVAKELVIPAKQTTANWTLTAAKDAPAWVGRLALIAETELEGKKHSLPVVGLTTVRTGMMRRSDGVVAAILGKAKP
jgi:hypothetical protein